MELGPISAIRPVSMARPSPPGSDSTSDLAGVFAIEFRNQQPDDSYSSVRKASRGLEEEDEPDENEPASAHLAASPESSATTPTSLPASFWAASPKSSASDQAN